MKAIWIRFVVVVKATKFFRLLVLSVTSSIHCLRCIGISHEIRWMLFLLVLPYHPHPSSVLPVNEIFSFGSLKINHLEFHCANYICSNWIINVLKFITRQTHILYMTDPICDPWFSLFVQWDCDTQFKKSLTHWLLPRESVWVSRRKPLIILYRAFWNHESVTFQPQR